MSQLLKVTYSDPAQILLADIRKLRRHPLVPGRIVVHGPMCDVDTGALSEVPEAMQEGAHDKTRSGLVEDCPPQPGG